VGEHRCHRTAFASQTSSNNPVPLHSHANSTTTTLRASRPYNPSNGQFTVSARPNRQRRTLAKHLPPPSRRLRIRPPSTFARCQRPPRVSQNASPTTSPLRPDIPPTILPTADLPQPADPRSESTKPIPHPARAPPPKHLRAHAARRLGAILRLPPLATAARRRQGHRRQPILAHRHDAKSLLHHGRRHRALILGNGAMGARGAVAAALGRHRESWAPRHECEDCCYKGALVERVE
jgi:hypothetical protein